ncbi:Gfo/Idh/MocA family protein [Sphingomonas aerophila]|uniref:Putative dehydrogenase n=1 Tax=Sphingomonas aerophila TaxID=1344948 RepID=A0A7W9EVU8_9SPHN|nr:Gfo/Idh/MocA family oxidoreductase [Sphingomonas aerophila]MBB5714848.1 putative dehydrogenase [Sphingomonas aerophila]
MTKPKIGFLGVGWIGRNRMEAMIETGLVEATAIVEPSDEMADSAVASAPGAVRVGSYDELLSMNLDGIVIATPSALHAQQSIRALQAGAAVFCQKPLGRSADEARAVVDAAQAADRLLTVDLSYRFTEAMGAIAPLVRSGDLGRIHAVDLVFHNAYGPDKPWFYDRALSGGGCVMDLGVHLVDLALWTLGFPKVEQVHSALSSGGESLRAGDPRVEDYAVATLRLGGGMIVRLACSWRLQAGQEAQIEASFYGTAGAAAMRNVGGSFYDFEADRYHGTTRSRLVGPPDAWGGRAAADWARRLAAGERFGADAEQLVRTSAALDAIYAGA